MIVVLLALLVRDFFVFPGMQANNNQISIQVQPHLTPPSHPVRFEKMKHADKFNVMYKIIYKKII